MPVPDKYDEAIAELLQDNPSRPTFEERVVDAWNYPKKRGPGALFQPCGQMGACGCLTQIVSREMNFDGAPYAAVTPELTEAILADDRIPPTPHDITPEDLPVFAEWQRKIDAMGVR
jgi:hypothetical protein